MKKTFLHICLSESWGGLEMAVSKWNAILSEHDHKNLNICTPNSPLAKDLKGKGFPVLEWDSGHYFSPDFTLKLRRLLKKQSIDAIVLQNLRDLWIVSPALWGNKKTKLIGFAQMLTSVKKKDILHQIVYAQLDHVMTLTNWQQQALRPYLPIPVRKYGTIPNFVDVNTFKPECRDEEARHRMGFKPEDFVIGIIGRIDEQKGQMELIQAFATLTEEYQKAHLYIVGEPTLNEPRQQQYYQSLLQFVKDNNLERRIHFRGFQKETQHLYANFDLFVLPSYQETFGFVVIEAMASGCPVLATQAGGVPEILGQGEYGFLCPAKDANSLSIALKQILDNKKLRQDKATLALARVRDFYDRQPVYQRFINLI